MGMSTHVVGLRDMDGEFRKMLEAKKFCEEKGLSYPREVADYFGHLVRDSEKTIADEMLEVKLPVKDWSDEYRQGYEIAVEDIPKECKTIRFYNAW